MILVPTRVQRFLIQDPIEATTRVLGGDDRTLPNFAADVRDDADHFYIDAELPGFRKQEIDVTLEKNLLTITATRSGGAPAQPENGSAEPQPMHWLLRERQTRSLERSFRLPPTVSDGEVHARLSDGVLHIVLNKREESKQRKIAVN